MLFPHYKTSLLNVSKKKQNAFIIASLVYGSADKKEKKKKTDRKEYSWRETCYMRSRKQFGYVFETLTKKVF